MSPQVTQGPVTKIEPFPIRFEDGRTCMAARDLSGKLWKIRMDTRWSRQVAILYDQKIIHWVFTSRIGRRLVYWEECGLVIGYTAKRTRKEKIYTPFKTYLHPRNCELCNVDN